MLTAIKVWAKSLAEQFGRPQTYSSALEQYIVANAPQSEGDVDRLAREFEYKKQNFSLGRGA